MLACLYFITRKQVPILIKAKYMFDKNSQSNLKGENPFFVSHPMSANSYYDTRQMILSTIKPMDW